jgi:hypothetical protein
MDTPNTMKRLEDGRIILDNLVWSMDPEKAIEIKNELTGNKVHSINLDGVYYYPSAIFNPKKHK